MQKILKLLTGVRKTDGILRLGWWKVIAAGSLIGCGCWAGADTWTLVWSDEFDKPGLPDPAKWGYEEGFVRNREVQYYTRDRLKNARVEDGLLVVEAHRESIANPRYRPDSQRWGDQRETAAYTSASLNTLGRASWTYGRFEVRAQLPRGQGVWPAIWTLGENRSRVRWPGCGEIDIMEYVGKDPERVHANIHYGRDGEHRSQSGSMHLAEPYDGFHVYAMEWTEDRIDFYVDETRYHSVALDQAGAGADNPFRKPHYLLINLAMGGSWGGEIDETILPQRYLIDYVRVYRRP